MIQNLIQPVTDKNGPSKPAFASEGNNRSTNRQEPSMFKNLFARLNDVQDESKDGSMQTGRENPRKAEGEENNPVNRTEERSAHPRHVVQAQSGRILPVPAEHREGNGVQAYGVMAEGHEEAARQTAVSGGGMNAEENVQDRAPVMNVGQTAGQTEPVKPESHAGEVLQSGGRIEMTSQYGETPKSDHQYQHTEAGKGNGMQTFGVLAKGHEEAIRQPVVSGMSTEGNVQDRAPVMNVGQTAGQTEPVKPESHAGEVLQSGGRIDMISLSGETLKSDHRYQYTEMGKGNGIQSFGVLANGDEEAIRQPVVSGIGIKTEENVQARAPVMNVGQTAGQTEPVKPESHAGEVLRSGGRIDVTALSGETLKSDLQYQHTESGKGNGMQVFGVMAKGGDDAALNPVVSEKVADPLPLRQQFQEPGQSILQRETAPLKRQDLIHAFVKGSGNTVHSTDDLQEESGNITDAQKQKETAENLIRDLSVNPEMQYAASRNSSKSDGNQTRNRTEETAGRSRERGRSPLMNQQALNPFVSRTFGQDIAWAGQPYPDETDVNHEDVNWKEFITKAESSLQPENTDRHQNLIFLPGIHIANLSVRRNVIPGLTQMVMNAASGKPGAESWQKHNIELEDGSKIQISVRKIEGIMQVRLGSTSPELMKLLQNHQHEIREHLEKESSLHIDVDVEHSGDDRDFHLFDDMMGKQVKSQTGNGQGEPQKMKSEPQGQRQQPVRDFGYNNMEWTA